MKSYSLLNGFVEPDKEMELLMEQAKIKSRNEISFMCKGETDMCLDAPVLREEIKFELDRVCPQCGKKYPHFKNYCPECLVTLKKITDTVDVKAIKSNPIIDFKGDNSYSNILSDECFCLIDEFDFTADDFKDIIHSIKSQAFKNLDKLIADNSIDLDMLDALDKVFAFAKSFVKVEYKSYGGELGYFEFDKVYVDDRQRKSLQITTLIHELTHFLVNEILVHVTCKILNTDKNRHIESVITYILSHSTFNSLVDEYAAHTVEGRFTIFGYQDYSSFLTIQKEMDTEEADIAKVIGNSFAIYIKDLLEGFIDWDLREEIKEQFLSDTLEQPDYRQLALENCSKLSDEGFMKAIWLILTEGLQNADEEVIKTYLNEFEN